MNRERKQNKILKSGKHYKIAHFFEELGYVFHYGMCAFAGLTIVGLISVLGIYLAIPDANTQTLKGYRESDGYRQAIQREISELELDENYLSNVERICSKEHAQELLEESDYLSEEGQEEYNAILKKQESLNVAKKDVLIASAATAGSIVLSFGAALLSAYISEKEQDKYRQLKEEGENEE